MEMLMETPNKVFSREQILQRLWGDNYSGEATNAVEVLVRTLRIKIGDPYRRVIRTVRGSGYTLHGSP
jgi:DNA-binding response OmpR family regulator